MHEGNLAPRGTMSKCMQRLDDYLKLKTFIFKFHCLHVCVTVVIYLILEREYQTLGLWTSLAWL